MTPSISTATVSEMSQANPALMSIVSTLRNMAAVLGVPLPGDGLYDPPILDGPEADAVQPDHVIDWKEP